jgi:PAS domain S-box-containing protein
LTVTLRDQLLIAHEELTVADEELRVQQDALIQAVDGLRVERQRYRDLFVHASVAYMVTDLHGGIREANRAMCALLRRRSDHLIGKPLAVFARDVSRRRIRMVLSRLATGARRAKFRAYLDVGADRVLPIEATVVTATDAAGHGELRWVIIDQRRRRRIERERRRHAEKLEAIVAERTAELQRAQRVKDQLIATVSHEMRTPLAAIGGYVEMLQMGLRGPLNEQQELDLARIHRAYEHLSHIVNDLLGYHKLVAGQLSFDVTDVRLDTLMAGVADLVMPQAVERGLVVAVEPVTPSIHVRGDPERLGQILINLLGNAIKYTTSGGIIRLRATVDQSHAVIEVEDTGPGIPASELESVFQPFSRLRLHEDVPGTGLGLAISRDLARAMHGDLTATSTVGEGSCFTLRIPLTAPDAHTAPLA